MKLFRCNGSDYKYTTILNDKSPGILLVKTKLRKKLSVLAQKLYFRKQLVLVMLIWTCNQVICCWVFFPVSFSFIFVLNVDIH